MTQPNEQLIETIQRAIADQSESGLDYIRDNGTEWLRALLEENKRLREIDERESTFAVNLRNELEQVKAERDALIEEKAEWQDVADHGWHQAGEETKLNESLHTELAAKDKVLQWLATNLLSGYEAKPVRDVLKLYPPREKGATE